MLIATIVISIQYSFYATSSANRSNKKIVTRNAMLNIAGYLNLIILRPLWDCNKRFKYVNGEWESPVFITTKVERLSDSVGKITFLTKRKNLWT